MFTVFSLKNSKELTKEELDLIYDQLAKWESKIPILQKVPWKEIHYKWCLDMGFENNVLGAFNTLDKVIYLSRQVDDDVKIDFQVGCICATLCHELVHWNQHNDFGPLLYAILAFPLWRNFTIEPPAYKVADMCYKLMEEEANKPIDKLTILRESK